jgi:RNA polymerase sigma factor (sigma-70 family)
MSEDGHGTVDFHEDFELAAQAALGDALAQRRVLELVAPVILQKARRATASHPHDAEDYAQEAMMQCLDARVLRRYRAHAPLLHYLRAVAYMRIITLARRDAAQKAREMRAAILSGDAWRVEEGADHDADSVGLGQALAGALALEPPFVELIADLKSSGLSNSQIADVLDCPRGSVGGAWHRAQQRLRVRLQAWDPNA